MPTVASYYETDRAVAEYLLFHFGGADLRMPWVGGPAVDVPFPACCAGELLEVAQLPPRPRALDLGCAVGRATFELARFAGEAVGIDRSERFIRVAEHLRQHGELAFAVTVEGDLTTPALARVPADIDRSRVRFETGDALALRSDLGDFDVVLAANLLDRVPRPGALLDSFATLVRPGGHLVLTSPYTWLEEYTPRAEWLCSKGRRTVEVLAERLGRFEPCRRRDVPFVLREHARKFQWGVAEVSVWRRRV